MKSSAPKIDGESDVATPSITPLPLMYISFIFHVEPLLHGCPRNGLKLRLQFTPQKDLPDEKLNASGPLHESLDVPAVQSSEEDIGEDLASESYQEEEK